MGFENVATEAAQNERVAMLKGKILLFISGSTQYPSMAPSLQDSCRQFIEWGVTIYAVFEKDKTNDNYYEMAKAGKTYHHELFAHMMEDDAPNNVVAALNAAGNPHIDGCWSPHESTQPIVGGVCDLLGLPGNPHSSYVMARDKFATRKALERAGLNTPASESIFTLADVDNAAKSVGFPMIIKPTSGGGSQGVYRVNDIDELKEKTQRLLKEASENWILSGNPGMKNTAPVLAETFIVPIVYGGDGDQPEISEFDCDILMWERKAVYSNVVDNWIPEAPYFQDRGFNCPSITPPNVQQQIKDYCAECVTALGFKQGNFHMEAWMTTSGPVLIECNPRVGGGSIFDLHLQVYGVDPSVNFFLSAMGIPINPPRSETPMATRLFYLVTAHKTGIFQDDTFLEKAKESKHITSAVYFKHKGDKVTGLDKGVPEWIGQLEMKGEAADVLGLCREMDDVVKEATEEAGRQTQGDVAVKPNRRRSTLADLEGSLSMASLNG
eukprot:CFRG6282T1